MCMLVNVLCYAVVQNGCWGEVPTDPMPKLDLVAVGQKFGIGQNHAGECADSVL